MALERRLPTNGSDRQAGWHDLQFEAIILLSWHSIVLLLGGGRAQFPFCLGSARETASPMNAKMATKFGLALIFGVNPNLQLFNPLLSSQIRFLHILFVQYHLFSHFVRSVSNLPHWSRHLDRQPIRPVPSISLQSIININSISNILVQHPLDFNLLRKSKITPLFAILAQICLDSLNFTLFHSVTQLLPTLLGSSLLAIIVLDSWCS